MSLIDVVAIEPQELAEHLTRPLVFVDLETTGGNATHDRITEIGVVEVGPAGIESWSTLVDPGMSIPPSIQQLTGISNEMVRHSPSFRELAEALAERLQGKLFVAHNVRFDYGFLKNEFKRAGITFKAPTLCTVRLSRALFPAAQRHGLDALIARLGLQPKGRHRALADADLLWQFWQKIHALYPVEVVDAAIKTLTQHASLPPALPEGALEHIPNSPGVYIFYGDGDIPLYVGKSINLKQRVAAHFSGDYRIAKDMRIAQQIRRIECRATAGEFGALLLEAQLVKHLLPAHNRMLRRAAELYAWQWQHNMPRPLLVSSRSVDFARAAGLYGTYTSKVKAEQALMQLADQHQLCHAVLGLEKTQGKRGCFGYQIKRCLGSCADGESSAAHTLRLGQALANLRLKNWPYAGPVAVFEPAHDTSSAEPESRVAPRMIAAVHALGGEAGAPDTAVSNTAISNTAVCLACDSAAAAPYATAAPHPPAGQWHIVNNWCYLGSVSTQAQIPALLAQASEVARFDRDIYAIVSRRLASGDLAVSELSAMSHFELVAPLAVPQKKSPLRQTRSGAASHKPSVSSDQQMQFEL